MRRLFTLPPEDGSVDRLAFDPPGSILAVAGKNHDVTLWDFARIEPTLVELGLGWDTPSPAAVAEGSRRASGPPAIIEATAPPVPKVERWSDILRRARSQAERGRWAEAEAGFARVAAPSDPDPQRLLEAGLWIVGPRPERGETVPPSGSGPFRSADRPRPDGAEIQPAPDWTTVHCDSTGYIALPATSPGTAHEITRLLAYVYTKAGHSARLRVKSGDPVVVRLNGELIHQSARPLRADAGPVDLAVSLRPGRNTLLVEVTRDTDDHRLYVEFIESGRVRLERFTIGLGTNGAPPGPLTEVGFRNTVDSTPASLPGR